MDLSHIKSWVFDLDGTLYHPQSQYLDDIWQAAESHIADKLGHAQSAERVAVESKIIAEHGGKWGGYHKGGLIDESTLDNLINAVPFDDLSQCEQTRALILGLTGEKYVFTDAKCDRAESLLKHLNLQNVFRDVSTLTNRKFSDKTSADAFIILQKMLNHDLTHAVLIDDSLHNLQIAAAHGMSTVFIGSSITDAPYAQYKFPTVLDFLLAVKA